MDSTMDDILRKMGWTTGMHLPIANNENKKLQDEVEELMLRKARATYYYETEESRYNAFESHLKFVKQQNLENQNLLTTYRQHFDSQEHKFLLTQSEKMRVEQEIRQMTKEMQDIETRIDGKQGDLARGMSKVEKMKSETNWDSEALKTWEESLKKRDEDNELLKKFSKEDERKAKELEARRQNLQMEVVNRKETLQKTIGDVINYEQVMERTAKVFNQKKEEEAALIRQWKEAIKTLKRRDNDIEQTIKEISMTQDVIQEEQEKLDEQNEFYKNEINNNKELEQQIEEANFTGCKLRAELNDTIQYVLTLNSELNALKRSLMTSANFLEKERISGRNLSKEMDLKEVKIKQSEIDVENLGKKLNDIKNSSMSAAERAKQLEQIIEAEQRQTRVLETDIERMQGVLFRTQQTLNDLKESAKLKDMEINGCEIATNILNKNSEQVNHHLQKQKEINYDLDFIISQMHSKLDKLEGQSSGDEDKQARQEKVQELEKLFSDENEVKSMLQGQVNQIEDEMRRLTVAIQSDNAQMEVLKDKLQNEVLSFEGGTKQSIVAKQRSQQRQVDENILRLRVNQLENIMKREENNIYNLQKFRLELETAMRERQIEINTNKDILAAKRRNMDEEKSRLKRDIMQRATKIEQLKQRFCIAIAALGKDEDGQPLSVTHFKIKNAQEKYMLQQEGDELDAKIKRQEKEIIAMENTLRVVNLANVTYKQSLSAVEEYDQETEEMQLLETEVASVTASVRNRKREHISKKNQLKELQQSLSAVDDERMEAQEALTIVENDYSDLQRHEIEQLEKINRADRHLHTCMRNLDMKHSEKYHKNLMIRQLQDANKSALQQLAEVSTRYQELTPHISRYTYENELQLPGPRLQFTPSSSSASTRSSEYYASGPCVSNVLLTFDASPADGKKRASGRKVRRNPNFKFKF